MTTADAVAILPAAGRGTRLGEPKQFLELDGIPLLVRAAMGAAACPEVAALVLAVPAGEEVRVRELLARYGADAKLHAVVAGGAERADSVRAAIAAAPPTLSYAVIHDAARPFASPALFTRVLEAARRSGAAVAAIPCTDTVKQMHPPDGAGAAPASTASTPLVKKTLDRRGLWLAQTPQAFRIASLQAAWERAGAELSAATDEASLIEALGEPVELVQGEKENFKVTDREDWDRAKAAVRGDALHPPFTVGFGYDVHAFAEGRPCILGGVEFPGETGLAGHSDADAAVHAVMDAILGAAALGDIGQHFPDSDERFRGASSLELLREVVRQVEEAGFQVANVDLTIAAARPRIGPRREEMRARIAEGIGIPPTRVNVKATTTEGLGFIGRSEGIAAQAVAMLGRRSGEL